MYVEKHSIIKPITLETDWLIDTVTMVSKLKSIVYDYYERNLLDNFDWFLLDEKMPLIEKTIENWFNNVCIEKNDNRSLSTVLKGVLPKEIVKNNNCFSQIVNTSRNYIIKARIDYYVIDGWRFWDWEFNEEIDCGDNNSCFKNGGCNEIVRVLVESNSENFKLGVFRLTNFFNGKEYWGRHWLIKLSDDCYYLTNFYCKESNWVKQDWFKELFKKTFIEIFEDKENWIYMDTGIADLKMEFFYFNKDGFFIARNHIDYSKLIEIVDNCEFICPVCDYRHYMEEIILTNQSAYYCDRYGEYYGYCKECDELERLYLGSDGNLYCARCYDYYENMESCDNCGDRYHSDDIYWVRDIFSSYRLCVYCLDRVIEKGLVYKCDHCGDYFEKQIVNRVIDVEFNVNDFYCEDCLNLLVERKEIAKCGYCEEYYTYVYRKAAYYYGLIDICPNCYNNEKQIETNRTTPCGIVVIETSFDTMNSYNWFIETFCINCKHYCVCFDIEKND